MPFGRATRRNGFIPLSLCAFLFLSFFLPVFLLLAVDSIGCVLI